MINVCYFERLLNVDLFEQVLTEGGGIALSRVGPEMADADVAAALTGIQGYHTRGGSQLVPPKFRIDKDFIAKCPNLIAVCTGGAGYDAITVPDCTEAGILVANQAGLNAEAVAEHALAMMLCLTKQIAQVNMALRRDPELDRFAFRNNDIFGKTLGIVGLGEIGTRVAEVCSTAFKMPVLTTHPRLTAEEAAKRHAELVSFAELLERSDFVLVACGLNDETRGMFGAEAFARVGHGLAFLLSKWRSVGPLPGLAGRPRTLRIRAAPGGFRRGGRGLPRRNAAGALCTSRHRAALAVGTWAALAWNLAPICCYNPSRVPLLTLG